MNYLATNAPSYTASLSNDKEFLGSIMEKCYTKLQAEAAEGFSGFKDALNPSKEAANMSSTLIPEFVKAELDYNTPGKRGIGRYSTQDYPRMASILKNPSNPEVREKLGYLMEATILYSLYVGSVVNEMMDQKHQEIQERNLENIWEKWIPSITDEISTLFIGDPSVFDMCCFATDEFIDTTEMIADNYLKRGLFGKADKEKFYNLWQIYFAAGIALFFSCTE